MHLTTHKRPDFDYFERSYSSVVRWAANVGRLPRLVINVQLLSLGSISFPRLDEENNIKKWGRQ